MTDNPTPESLAQFEKSVDGLRKARSSPADPAQFWQEFLDASVGVLGAQMGLAAVRRAAQSAEQSNWRPMAISPETVAAGPVTKTVVENLDIIGELCKTDGSAIAPVDGGHIVAVRIDTGPAQELCVAAFMLRKLGDAELEERRERLLLIADTPNLYQINRIASESTTHVEHFSGVLDLMVLVNSEKRFMAAAMVLCNELASRHQCERVSVGWLENGYVRVKAMSHVENFERKMEAVQSLETVMEESLDQDEEIVLPCEKDDGAVVRDHEVFLEEQDGKNICSLPIRVDGEPIAVVTCERSSSPFTDREVRLLRLSCDHVARRLADLKRYDRWFGARMMLTARENLEPYLGSEHTWGKVIAITVAVLLAFICFVPIRYRVEAPFILRTDDVAYMTTPFEGHIDNVYVKVGDRVKKGQTLLVLDQGNLLLEEVAAVAESNRYEREAEKSRAKGALADMRIAEALKEQADARLALIRHRLETSVIRAPMAGLIVEGDLMEREGAPVRQGDVLFKLAQIKRVYAELDVGEKDIHQVPDETDGRIAFASRPQDIFPVHMVRIEPVAVPKEDGNTFVVRCEISGDREGWWRPGMTGVAKLDAGWRTPLWILTHRTIDFLRLKMWW